MKLERVFSQAPWEKVVGYCRAVKAGDRIHVTGTAPIDESGQGVHAPGDARAQAARCLELIERALAGFGADRRHVVRTRMFVTDISRWREYGEAHGAFFANCPPAELLELLADVGRLPPRSARHLSPRDIGRDCTPRNVAAPRGACGRPG